MIYEIKENGKLKKFEVTGKAEKLFFKYSEMDFKKNKISLCEYHYIIPYLLHDLSQKGKTKTISTSIKEWFKNQGCTINPDKYNLNFEITL